MTAAELLDERGPRPLLIGHRGGVLNEIENTLDCFSVGLDADADALFTEVMVSRDGKPVLIKGSSLSRVFDIDRKVEDMTAVELRHAGVPTLDDALSLIDRRAPLIVDVSAGERQAEVACKAVVDREMEDAVILMSDESAHLQHGFHAGMRLIEKASGYAASWKHGSHAKILSARRMGLAPTWRMVDNWMLKAMRKQNVPLIPHVVPDDKAAEMVDKGVRAMIVEDIAQTRRAMVIRA